MERLFNYTVNRITDPHRQCPSISLSSSLSCISSPSVLSVTLPLSLSLCMFMHGHRTVSYQLCTHSCVGVCMSLCVSVQFFVLFPYVNIIVDHIKGT